MVSEGLRRAITSAYLLTFLSRLADLLFFYILYDKLATTEVGIFNTAMALAAFIAAFFDFGINQVLVREFSRRTINFRTALYISSIIRFPLAIASIIFLSAATNFYLVSYEWFKILCVVGLIQFVIVHEGLIQSWLKANFNQFSANFLLFLDPLSRLLSIIVLLTFTEAIYILHVLFAILFCHILIIIFHGYKLYCVANRINKEREICSNSNSPRIITSGIVVAFMAFITVVQNRSDWLLLTYYFEPHDLANYALSNKFYEIIITVVGVSIISLLPSMFRNKKSYRENLYISLVLSITSAFGAILSLCGAVYLPDIISFLFSDKYENASPIIQLMLPLSMASTFIMARYYLMFALGLERQLLLISILATILQLSLNIILIPHFGTLGATAGMAALVITTYSVYTLYAVREKCIKIASIYRELIYIGAFSTITLFIGYIHAPIYIGLPVLIFIGACSAYSLLLDYKSRVLLNHHIDRIYKRFR